MLLHEVESAQRRGGGAAFERLAEQFGLERRGDQWTATAAARIAPEAWNDDALSALEGRVNSRIGDLITLRFPVDRLAELVALPGLLHLETGMLFSPELQHSVRDTRADSVHAGLGGLPQGYTGEGVVVGVIDWGFDYTHPVFRDTALAELRLTKAWDQNKMSGPHPTGYDYGAQYVGMDELLAAGSDTLYVFGPSSHGTHVAGIAAGNGAGTEQMGMAPGAELVFVSLRRDVAGFIDAITWIRDHAESVGKPFVVNMSFGSHLGPHDGTLLQNQAMDAMAGPGRVFVGSAGNNGTGNFHLKHSFTVPNDTMRTVVNWGNAAGLWGQAVAIWGDPGTSFSLGLRFTDMGNTTIHAMPFEHTADDPLVADTVVLAAGDTIIVRLAGEQASDLNGKPNMVLEVRRTVNRKVVIELTASGGDVHLWNIMRLSNRFTNWGVAFANNYPGAVGGDNLYALGEPAGVGQSVITVASHRGEQVGPTGNLLYGHRSSFSSRGPTVDGRVKPDISGPGESVRSSTSTFDPGSTNAPQTVPFQGVNYPFQTFSGTSMSSPAVAGVVALMLQANPWLSADQVKELIKETARLDNFTGEIGPEGNLEWGWGKVNALAAVLAAATFVSTNDIQAEPHDVVAYPNPTDGLLYITGMEAHQVRVFNMAGQAVLEQRPAQAGGALVLSLEGLPTGVYLVELRAETRVVYKRVVLR